MNDKTVSIESPQVAAMLQFVHFLPDAALVMDQQLRVRAANNNIAHLLGISPPQLAGMAIDSLLPQLAIVDWNKEQLPPQAVQLVTRVAGIDAELFIQPMPLPEGYYSLLIIRDISEHRQQCEKLEQLARTDELTGLANRRHFMDLAEKEIERFKRYGGHLSLAMFDVDKFKSINDHYGHLAGDQVLKNIAQRCRKVLRDIDVMARLGGDEFIVLMPQTNIKQARQTMERIRTRIAQHLMEFNEHVIQTSISAGVVEAFANVQNIDEVIRRADAALYAAKDAGRNQVKAGYYPLPAVC